MNWFTKKNLILIGFIASVLFFISYFIHSSDFCYWKANCSLMSEILSLYLLPFLSVFTFSLITYWLKDSIFISWRNFSVCAVFISLIIISFLPTDTHGLDFIPITKGTTIFFLTILYSFISLGLILYKSFKK